MNRHIPSNPRAILPLAGWADNGRIRGAKVNDSLELDSLLSFGRLSAEASKSDVLRLMAAGLVHDINNMLHISVGAVELLRDRIDEKQMEDISDLSKIALMSLGRASAMAHDFLSFTRPMQADSKPVCVNATIESMGPLLKCTLGDEIDIKLTLAEGLPRIACNRQRLESAILNLAINARDAMPVGGRLVITTFHIEPIEKCRGPMKRNGIAVRVTDTGKGMSPDVLRRAFDLFYTTKSHGTGLGLAMIREFVEQFRGKVSATSTAGHGTTVELHFPVN
jgi:signal transduction histidine kinase